MTRGSSRGHWDGDTLVVETRNFRDIGTAHAAPNMERLEALGSDLVLVERFSRLDDDTLLYRFTMNDPTAFTQPWSVETTMARSENTLYEYACHEGNYGLYNILAGAQREAQAASVPNADSRDGDGRAYVAFDVELPAPHANVARGDDYPGAGSFVVER